MLHSPKLSCSWLGHCNMVYDLLKMVEIVSTTIVPIIYDSELITVVGAQDFVNHNWLAQDFVNNNWLLLGNNHLILNKTTSPRFAACSSVSRMVMGHCFAVAMFKPLSPSGCIRGCGQTFRLSVGVATKKGVIRHDSNETGVIFFFSGRQSEFNETHRFRCQAVRPAH